MHYRVPELLSAAIVAAGCAGCNAFAHSVFRLCTGLMGVKLRPVAQRLDDYDI